MILSNLAQGLCTRVGLECLLILSGVLGGKILVAKSSGMLEKIATGFSLAQTLNMGWIGHICWIMDIIIVGHGKFNSLH